MPEVSANFATIGNQLVAYRNAARKSKIQVVWFFLQDVLQ